MAGHLDLTPWARAALPEPMRAELRRVIPDGWTIALSAPRHRRYKAWANDDRTGRYALHIVERPTASAAVMDVIFWIRGLADDA